MRHQARILVIDDERSVCITCRRILEAVGHKVDHNTVAHEGVRQAVSGDYELVLLDLKMPGMSGLEALEAIKRERPDISVVIITGYATIQTSIEAIKKGAFNYVPKPFTPEELEVAVDKALDDRAMRGENEFLRKELGRVQRDMNILGRSDAIEEIRRQILKVSPSGFTVSIYGESGTGKELIAQAVHMASERAEKAFVAVDISSLTPTLVESELFGHVKGAFTGATQTRPGYFALADGGTLFLDEISNLSLEIQGKLLRVLESRMVRPVGGENERAVDVRIVTATNRDLYELVERGIFREDLYYRLNVIPLVIPPLRERSDDVPLLAMHFLAAATARAGSPTKGFTTAAMAKLISYEWPGNVRELKNIVERIVATSDGEFIDVPQLPANIAGRAAATEDVALESVPQNAEDLKNLKRDLKDRLYERVETAFLEDALERNDGNISRAAEDVGMLRPNFHALMRKYGVKPGQRSTPRGGER